MSKVIRLPEVKARTGRSRTSIYRDIQTGKFPAPVKIGDRAIGWIDSTIDQWIAERLPARTALPRAEAA